MRSKLLVHLRHQWMGALALFLVLTGGVAYAANTVRSSDIVDNEVRTADVRNDTLTGGGLGAADLQPNSVGTSEVAANSLNGGDINESTLGNVPAAAKANDAFSTFHDGAVALPDSIGAPTNPIKDLSIPHAGNYVISATLWAGNSDFSGGASQCVLAAGADSDTKGFYAAAAQPASVALQVVHSFSDGGLATLSCTDQGSGNVKANNTKITAIQVNNLTNG